MQNIWNAPFEPDNIEKGRVKTLTYGEKGAMDKKKRSLRIIALTYTHELSQKVQILNKNYFLVFLKFLGDSATLAFCNMFCIIMHIFAIYIFSRYKMFPGVKIRWWYIKFQLSDNSLFGPIYTIWPDALIWITRLSFPGYINKLVIS